MLFYLTNYHWQRIISNRTIPSTNPINKHREKQITFQKDQSTVYSKYLTCSINLKDILQENVNKMVRYYRVIVFVNPFCTVNCFIFPIILFTHTQKCFSRLLILQIKLIEKMSTLKKNKIKSLAWLIHKSYF